MTPFVGKARQLQQGCTVQQDIQNWNNSFNELLATNLEQAVAAQTIAHHIDIIKSQIK